MANAISCAYIKPADSDIFHHGLHTDYTVCVYIMRDGRHSSHLVCHECVVEDHCDTSEGEQII
jgi:hypothetical protein